MSSTMAPRISTGVFFFVLCFLSSLPSRSQARKVHFEPNQPLLVQGLSWNFYQSSCPKLEHVIRKEIQKAIKKDVGIAAGLLRIHFHDCFVQGCDASVLLAGSTAGPGEKASPPNLTLRPAALALIDRVRERVHSKCGAVVSCSDITALAARDSVHLTGGPDYPVPLGRRDSRNFATMDTTLAFLPAPSSRTTELINLLGSLGLDTVDLVALSGGHTIGIANCPSFTDRLFPQDPSMDQWFANQLKQTCPAATSQNTTVMDIRTPNVFDNKYYVDLMNRQGLFTSDQDLYTDQRTRDIVKSFAIDQGLFFERFAASMVKMGQLNVLTGGQGEVRVNCSAVNTVRGVDVGEGGFLWSVVEEDQEIV